jgi:hypothetical protein
MNVPEKEDATIDSLACMSRMSFAVLNNCPSECNDARDTECTVCPPFKSELFTCGCRQHHDSGHGYNGYFCLCCKKPAPHCTMQSDGVLFSMKTVEPKSCACIPPNNASTIIAVSDLYSVEVYEGHDKPWYKMFAFGLVLIVTGVALYFQSSLDTAIQALIIIIGLLACLPTTVVLVRNMICGGAVRISFYEHQRVGSGPWTACTNHLSPEVVWFTFSPETKQSNVEAFASMVLQHGQAVRAATHISAVPGFASPTFVQQQPPPSSPPHTVMGYPSAQHQHPPQPTLPRPDSYISVGGQGTITNEQFENPTAGSSHHDSFGFEVGDPSDHVCAYQNTDTGRRCKTNAVANGAGGFGKFCETHTCGSPSCNNPKSSKEQFCEYCAHR